MDKKCSCCNGFRKFAIDYSQVPRTPYFGKRKEREAWLKARRDELGKEPPAPADNQ